jgi:tetratricopeptide (TPR) repeat protein
LLGTVQEKLGNRQEALRSFKEAVALAPGNEDFRVDYASSLVNAELLDQAVAAFSEGIARLPQSMRLRLGLSSALYLSGKYEEAAQASLDCVSLNPKFAPAYDLLGKLFESAPERQEKIVAAFQAYMEADPADAAAHSHYGVMLYAKGRPVEAKKHLTRALALNPKLPEAHLQLGVISQADGNLAEAIASYQRAVAIAPAYAAARYRLGLAYQKLGQTAKAQAELETFRKLNKPK